MEGIERNALQNKTKFSAKKKKLEPFQEQLVQDKNLKYNHLYQSPQSKVKKLAAFKNPSKPKTERF